MSHGAKASTSLPPRHIMVHPGPARARRTDWTHGHLRSIRATGCGAQSLRDAIIAAAHAHGVDAGTGHFTDCALDKTRFTTGGPARDGKAANYTFIRDLGATSLPWGTFTFGTTPDGAPFVHCHAVIDEPGATEHVGGHLFPPDCVVDRDFSITINGLEGVSLVQQSDAETLHSVFELGDERVLNGDALFVRVRPNEDVTEALETVCRTAGVTDATICPSIGSLNAPSIVDDHGSIRPLTSVGMEVLRFSGIIEGGHATVYADLVDEEGAIYRGQMVAGHAPVCVTAELMLLKGR